MFTVNVGNQTEQAFDGKWSFPSAPEDNTPALLYRKATGTSGAVWKRLYTEYQEDLQEYLDEQPELTDEDREALREIAEEEGDEVSDEDIERMGFYLLTKDFVPEDGLRGRLIDWCVEHTVGTENIYIQDDKGQKVPFRWNDDEWIREHTGEAPEAARRALIDSFGGTPEEMIQTPINYAYAIYNGSTLDDQQKKESGS